MAAPPISVEVLAARLSYHGIAGLLDATAPGLPEGLRQQIRSDAVAQLHQHRVTQPIISELCEAFHASGIKVLMFKGAALALTLYDRPEQRQRSDTDLWVETGKFDESSTLLERMGFERQVSAAGRGSARARSFVRNLKGARLEVDLHARLSNAPVIASLFQFNEVFRLGRSPDAFPPSVRVPAPVDALLIAAIHRRVHMGSPYYVAGRGEAGDRLIWLKDIELLARAIGPEFDPLLSRAGQAGIGPAVADALGAARPIFGALTPEGLDWGKPGPALQYLAASRFRRVLSDLWHEPGLSARGGLVRDLMLPSARYMRARFGSGWLPALYLSRLANAAKGGDRRK